jgi:shikimate kinase
LTDHVVLVGLMATGKTTIGRELARRLRRPFVDSDEQIEADTGRTVREIWNSDGETAYRRLEADALRTALGSSHPSVVAAAGGVVLDPANRERLRDAGTVVWLDANPSVLAERAGADDHRPLLDDDPKGALERMARERRNLYEEVADHRVDVTSLAVDAAVERVLALLDDDDDDGDDRGDSP